MHLVNRNRSRGIHRNYDLATKLFSEFDRMASPARAVNTYSTSAVNGTDLYETADAFILEMAIPGIKRENIDINLEGRNLDIHASYKTVEPVADVEAATEAAAEVNTNENVAIEATEVAERKYHYRSLRLADINRKVHLPESVQVDAIDAKVEDGILLLTMPKAAEAQPRKISVN